MKLRASGAAAATTCSICLAAFLTIISASGATPQSGPAGLKPAEEWVVARLTVGEEADLSKQFSDKDKEKGKLRAHFLEDLLLGVLPGVKLHRNGVRIVGAIIEEVIDLKNAHIPCEVWLNLCQFNKSVTFANARRGVVQWQRV
jgi:hypothetical protein